MSLFQATYVCLARQASVGDFRTLEAHARTWAEAHRHLPKFIYPAGRKYRRISGPRQTDTGEQS